MKYFIAHRGNINGPNPDFENEPRYIRLALNKGFNAEVDIWYIENKSLWLGHDYPKYKIYEDFLFDSRIWVHAKDIKTFIYLTGLGVNCFFSKKDELSYTTRNFIWLCPSSTTIPNLNTNNKVICVMPEQDKSKYSDWRNKINLSKCEGICSDYIEKYWRKYAKD